VVIVSQEPDYLEAHRQAGTPTRELQKFGSWKTVAMGERHAHVTP
jgi:hypothetical protein